MIAGIAAAGLVAASRYTRLHLAEAAEAMQRAAISPAASSAWAVDDWNRDGSEQEVPAKLACLAEFGVSDTHQFALTTSDALTSLPRSHSLSPTPLRFLLLRRGRDRLWQPPSRTWGRQSGVGRSDMVRAVLLRCEAISFTFSFASCSLILHKILLKFSPRLDCRTTYWAL